MMQQCKKQGSGCLSLVVTPRKFSDHTATATAAVALAILNKIFAIGAALFLLLSICSSSSQNELHLIQQLFFPNGVRKEVEAAYIVEHKERLNGHSYTVRQEQPFFRVYHTPHEKTVRPKSPVTIPVEQQHKLREMLKNLSAEATTVPTVASQRTKEEEKGTQGASSTPPPSSSRRQKPRFGHHHLPAGESRSRVAWPEHLQPYLACMDLGCQCGLFNGTAVPPAADGSAPQCRLPSGEMLPKALRKEYRQYTAEERQQLIETFSRLRASGLYRQLGLIHRRNGVHSGPGFFPWHREFQKRVEMVFRSVLATVTYPRAPRLGLPYWDSSMDNRLVYPGDSVWFSDFLMGEAGPDAGGDSDDGVAGGYVFTGPFANWTTMDGRPSYQRAFGAEADGELINEARIDFVMNQTDISKVTAFSLPLHTCVNYTMDDRFLEFSHDYVHYFISGDMLERFTSSNDPIFFMHHSFIDSIWERWRQLRQNRTQRELDYPRDDGECMPKWHFSHSVMSNLAPLTNRDALSNAYTDNLYEYAERPTCERTNRSRECDSEFLFCDTWGVAGNDTATRGSVCVAKVKPGGRCEGYEGSEDACYQGRCLRGRCVKLAKLDGGGARWSLSRDEDGYRAAHQEELKRLGPKWGKLEDREWEKIVGAKKEKWAM